MNGLNNTLISTAEENWWAERQVRLKSKENVEQCTTDKIGDTVGSTNKRATRVPEREERENGAEAKFKQHYKL